MRPRVGGSHSAEGRRRAPELRRRRRARRAVDAGTVLALLGPNGAGKTTLSSCIAGLRQVDQGSITVDGIDAVHHPSRAQERIGLAPQETGIYESLTVLENLTFFCELVGLKGADKRRRIDEVAEAVSLTDLLDRPSQQLSGGEKRRLHTGIALVHGAPLLLLDEPTVGADVATRSNLLEVVRSLAADGIANTSDGPVDVDVVADDNPFTDVPTWVKSAVDWITYWDLADSYTNNTYRPDRSITRAEVTRMLWRYAGEQTPGGTHGFSDVPQWVEDAVAWATSDPSGPAEPVMAGFPDGTFRPNDPINRAEVVRLLYRYVGSPPVGSLPSHGFSDVPAWVQDAVPWAAHDPDASGPLESVVGGFTDGTFRPNDDITRAQLTRSLFRLTDQLVD